VRYDPPPMEHWIAELDEAVAAWGALGWPAPGVALVSGSGLAVDLPLPSAGRVPLQRLLPFPVHAIAGHPLDVELLVPAGAAPVLYFRGRLHSYQGYDAAQTVFPVRLATLLGARVLLLTNAAGVVSERLRPGQLAIVTDQLNLMGLNPLRGTPPAEWGPRFPDMVDAYDPALRALLRRHADELGVDLGDGVYAGLPGPSYETPAEVRMLRALGADLVGMSTVLEVIAARHMGVRCACISLGANAGAGLTATPLTHAEVLEAGATAAAALQKLFARVLVDPLLVGQAVDV
jgi:purine-nucleoside phosphorylase